MSLRRLAVLVVLLAGCRGPGPIADDASGRRAFVDVPVPGDTFVSSTFSCSSFAPTL